jgi:hypothetical protein
MNNDGAYGRRSLLERTTMATDEPDFEKLVPADLRPAIRSELLARFKALYEEHDKHINAICASSKDTFEGILALLKPLEGDLTSEEGASLHDVLLHDYPNWIFETYISAALTAVSGVPRCSLGQAPLPALMSAILRRVYAEATAPPSPEHVAEQLARIGKHAGDA